MRRINIFEFIIVLTVSVICTSCTTVEPDNQASVKTLVPASFTRSGSKQMNHDCWWESFGSEELNHLIVRVIAGNNSLAQAEARLRQARAMAVKLGAARKPSLSIKGDVSSTDRDKALIAGGDKHSESGSLSLAAGYEIDLWGRLASVTKSAELNSVATQEDLESVRISISAETALRYFELLSIRGKQDLVKRQIETSKKILELTDLRFRRSQGTALDVLQQRENLAALKTVLPPLLGREQVLLNELSVLVGVSVGSDLGLKARGLPALPELPDAGIPSELLARRPDVRSAMLRLQASCSDVHSAKADRLPSLRITGSAGYSSTEINNIFDSWITQLAGSLIAPIIDGGARKAEVDRTRAIVDERLAGYRGIVLSAIREVEDALVLEEHQVKYLDSLNNQIKAARRSYNEAIARYKKGAQSYVSALLELNNVQRLERQLTDASFNRTAYRISLYRALAGRWDKDEANEGAR